MHLRISSLILGASLLAATAHGQAIPTPRIDSIFAEFDGTHRPGCAVGVYREGSLAYARGYGMANLEYGIALQPRSVFHVASISKQFTAFAVELLVADGRVSWDDPIQKYVPEIPEYDDVVTLRHLVHHTSGIRDQWNLLLMAGWRWEADLVTQRNAIDVMARQRALNFPPGRASLYSNSGYTLLAAVVERVSGQSLRDFTEEHIFAPLGMTDTHFHDDHQMIVPDRAYGYRNQGRRGWKMSIPDFAIVGASSLFTTVEDMARWDANLRNHVLGNAALYDRFLEVGRLNDGEMLTYAHGIVNATYRGQSWVGHGGADAGYRSNFLRFPEQDLGIAVFCNFAAANPGGYARAVADIVLANDLDAPGGADPDPPQVDADRWANTWETMTGFYRNPLSDIPMHVWVYRGEARVRRGMGRGRAGNLIVPGDDGTFTLWPDDVILRVTRRDGRVRQLDTGRDRYEFVGPGVRNADPAPYVGTYWSEELGTEYIIRPDSGSGVFVMTHRTANPRTFRSAYPDGFFSGGEWITFTRDAGNRITGFTWSNGRVWKVRFDRVD